MVNKGIRDMVVQNHGIDAWHKIRAEANCEQDLFTSIQPYEDSITYDLVGAAAKVLGVSGHDVLMAYGNYWITFTKQEGYSNLLQLSGETLPEFLSNLDDLHIRLGSTYRGLRLPSFQCEEIDDSTLLLEYHSEREGLSSFVMGILQGLGKFFNVSVKLEHVKKRENFGFDEFLVKYFSLEETVSKVDNVENKNSFNGEVRCPFSQIPTADRNI